MFFKNTNPHTFIFFDGHGMTEYPKDPVGFRARLLHSAVHEAQGVAINCLQQNKKEQLVNIYGRDFWVELVQAINTQHNAQNHLGVNLVSGYIQAQMLDKSPIHTPTNDENASPDASAFSKLRL